jgi:hypothetical protein
MYHQYEMKFQFRLDRVTRISVKNCIFDVHTGIYRASDKRSEV